MLQPLTKENVSENRRFDSLIQDFITIPGNANNKLDFPMYDVKNLICV